MASQPKARQLVGDLLLVGGLFLVIGAQVINHWWWFLGLLVTGICMAALSLAVVPLRDQLARLGHAPVKDSSKERNVPSASDSGGKDAI